MTKTLKDVELSNRLRTLIEGTFPTRGRFGVLENVSGISASRWKNFYYRKQEAAPDMVDFWCKKYPMEQTWLLTGIEAPNQAGFPFGAPVPRDWEGQTMGDRLNWVIKEWASPSGEQLFAYLESKSRGRIPAAEWSRVVLRLAEPTLEMAQLVCQFRPRFTEWVLLGRVLGEPQVDPTDQSSIESWKKWYDLRVRPPARLNHRQD
ncbi:hypothetical protein [Ralstonia solanacearum]|uniref:hypothetical protein n=1 Tax=Ralstonia solanacearum TaxID=305 RepID=UPI000E56E5EC|nr:hypothetical protein [Ralstonia solanacearum]AXW22512.1 hypothetical protein CJO86_02295 [Ralstonia solanacearum]